jgi:hypothetical protein
MRDVVDLAASEPPPLRHTVDEIVQRGQRLRRRRRAGWAASGAAVVAVLGVTAAVAMPSLAGRQPTVLAGSPVAGSSAAGDTAQTFARPAQAFMFTFGGYRVGKLRVAQPIDVSTAYQIAPVYDDTLASNDKPVDPSQISSVETQHVRPPSLYAYLTFFQPGAYDPTKLRNPQHVTIAGRPGLQTIGSGAGGGVNLITLAWQYGPNGWAVLTSSSTEANDPTATQLQQLAAGLRPAAPTPARVPFTMTYVPSGYSVDEVAMHAMAGLNGIAAAEDGDYAGLLFSKPALPTAGLTEPFGGVDGNDPPGSFQIFVTPAANSNQQASPGITCENGFCNRWADGGSVDLQVASGGRLSDGEMTKILTGITLGNVHDENTWTVATTAIP